MTRKINNYIFQTKKINPHINNIKCEYCEKYKFLCAKQSAAACRQNKDVENISAHKYVA